MRDLVQRVVLDAGAAQPPGLWVVVDAARVARWRGGAPSVWALRQSVGAGLGLEGPGFGVFKTGEAALAAYAEVRAALVARLQGFVVRDVRAEAPCLAPALARAEAFSVGGVEVARLRVDQVTDALALDAMTAAVSVFSLGGRAALGMRVAGPSLPVATTRGAATHTALQLGASRDAWVPGDLAVDVPSGVVVVMTAATHGAALIAEEGDAGVETALRALGEADAAPLAAQQGVARAWALRVLPGRYRVAVAHGGDGTARGVALVHADAAVRSVDDDPPVLPETGCPRASDYARFRARVQRDGWDAACAAEGLDDDRAAATEHAWMKAMLHDPGLVARVMAR
jgi:hypothetical protein